MRLTGHKTEAVYRRYAIVSEADLAAGVTRLAVLHESLTKGTRTVVPMRPVRSGGGHPGHRGCGQPRAAAPRSGPRARRAPPQHLRAGAPRSRPRGHAAGSIRFCPITRLGTKGGAATLQARTRHREVTDEGDCGDGPGCGNGRGKAGGA